MKSKLMLDLSVYMIAPIILCNIVEYKSLTYLITGLLALVTIYSFSCKYKEGRINLTGLVFTFTFIVFVMFRKEQLSSYQIYIYDTYILMLYGVAILVLTVLEKDAIRRVYIDIQRAKGINNLSIWSNIKKSDMTKEFKKLSYIVSSHLVIISLIKIYSMSVYGETLYTKTQNLEVWMSVIFLLAEMYMISNIMAKSKEVKNIKKSKKKSRYNLNSSRVVSFEQYKNTNK